MSIYKEAVSYFNFLKLSQNKGQAYRDRSYERCDDPFCTIKGPHSKHFKYNANTGAGLPQTKKTPQKQPQYYPRINPQIQRTIFDFANIKGVGVGIDENTIKNLEDGFLGPTTRDVIEKVKTYFNNKAEGGLTSVGKITMGPKGDSYLFKIINKEYNKALNAPKEDKGEYQGPIPGQYEEPASDIKADKYNPYDAPQSGAGYRQPSAGKQTAPGQRESDEEYFKKREPQLKGMPSGKQTVGPMHQQMENKILKSVEKGGGPNVLAPGKTQEVAGPK